MTQYENLGSCLNYGTSPYKRNLDYHINLNDKGASSRIKEKVSKKSAKQISHEDEEDYT